MELEAGCVVWFDAFDVILSNQYSCFSLTINDSNNATRSVKPSHAFKAEHNSFRLAFAISRTADDGIKPGRFPLSSAEEVPENLAVSLMLLLEHHDGAT